MESPVTKRTVQHFLNDLKAAINHYYRKVCLNKVTEKVFKKLRCKKKKKKSQIP